MSGVSGGRLLWHGLTVRLKLHVFIQAFLNFIGIGDNQKPFLITLEKAFGYLLAINPLSAVAAHNRVS